MSYRCLTQTRFSANPYALIPIKKEHLHAIKEWRNAQIAVLRQAAPLSDHDQEEYWHNVIEPQFSVERPPQVLFSFLKEEFCIGYGGLTHIDWISRRAEVSFLLNPERTKDSALYKHDFTAFLKLLVDAAFNTLAFHRLYTETFDMRPLHVAVLEAFGFRLEGRFLEHNLIEGAYIDSVMHGFVKGVDDVLL